MMSSLLSAGEDLAKAEAKKEISNEVSKEARRAGLPAGSTTPPPKPIPPKPAAAVAPSPPKPAAAVAPPPPKPAAAVAPPSPPLHEEKGKGSLSDSKTERIQEPNSSDHELRKKNESIRRCVEHIFHGGQEHNVLIDRAMAARLCSPHSTETEKKVKTSFDQFLDCYRVTDESNRSAACLPHKQTLRKHVEKMHQERLTFAQSDMKMLLSLDSAP